MTLVSETPHLLDEIGHQHPLRELSTNPRALAYVRHIRNAATVALDLVMSEPEKVHRLQGKLSSERDFWPSMLEVFWASRLSLLGLNPSIEPTYPQKGPDLSFVANGVTVFAECYSPAYDCNAFVWESNVHRALEKTGFSGHLGLERLPAQRDSSQLKQLKSTILKFASSLLDKDDWVRLCIFANGTTQHWALRSYVSFDYDENYQQDIDPLFVVDLKRSTNHGMSTSTHHGADGTSAVWKDRSAIWLSNLGQLIAGSPNLFLLDGSRAFVDEDNIEAECKRPGGTFERHPELSAVIVSRIGLYWGEQIEEDYHLITNDKAIHSIGSDVTDLLTRHVSFGV